MPIKGLTEKKRLPRLGKIHLGIKSEKGFPQKVDYFVCPPEVQAVFGEKPKELRILIPVEDEERWCSQYYRCYSKTRGLVCKGDGETCMRTVDRATGDLAWKDEAKEVVMKEMPCAGRDCPDYKTKCKEIMNLQFLLPEVPGLGIWQIDTGSINSIRNINDTAELIKRIYGRISMLPLLLTLEPLDVTTPEHKKQKVWVLYLRIKETLIEMLQLARKPTDEILELPVGDDELPELLLPENQETASPAPLKAEMPPAKPAPEWGIGIVIADEKVKSPPALALGPQTSAKPLSKLLAQSLHSLTKDWTPEQLKARLDQYKVDSIESLSAQQASQLYNDLAEPKKGRIK